MQLFATIVGAISTILIYRGAVTSGQTTMRREDSPCYPWPGILFDEKRIEKLEKESLRYDGLVYPAGSYRVLGNKTHGCICNLRACVKKCCRKDEILGEGDRPKCTGSGLATGQLAPDLLPEKEQLASEIRSISGVSEVFAVVEGMRCPENMSIRYMLEPERYEEDSFALQRNGSLATWSAEFPGPSYCLDWKESFAKIAAVVCRLPDISSQGEHQQQTHQQRELFNFGIIVSIPFFFATFLVYAIIPELRTLYGKTLMCYVGCLVVAYTFLVSARLVYLPFVFCFSVAFIIYFSFLASFFWLNVMCFDIWWTFGGFRSLQGSVTQRERKKFIMYSIYAWGCASIFTAICAIMDFAPSIPKNFIRPKFGESRCWFDYEEDSNEVDLARALYFYGPMGITVVCNMCLFVSTAFKIVKHKRDVAHQLRGVDSRRHDDNTQWFNLYLKLFIVMGINWSMEIISWLCHNEPPFLWYLTDLFNTLQGLIIFLIFVWKDKIKRLLAKRFGCHRLNFLSRNSTRCGCNSSAASRTCTTTGSVASSQEKAVLRITDASHTKSTF